MRFGGLPRIFHCGSFSNLHSGFSFIQLSPKGNKESRFLGFGHKGGRSPVEHRGNLYVCTLRADFIIIALNLRRTDGQKDLGTSGRTDRPSNRSENKSRLLCHRLYSPSTQNLYFYKCITLAPKKVGPLKWRKNTRKSKNELAERQKSSTFIPSV